MSSNRSGLVCFRSTSGTAETSSADQDGKRSQGHRHREQQRHESQLGRDGEPKRHVKTNPGRQSENQHAHRSGQNCEAPRRVHRPECGNSAGETDSDHISIHNVRLDIAAWSAAECRRAAPAASGSDQEPSSPLSADARRCVSQANANPASLARPPNEAKRGRRLRQRDLQADDAARRGSRPRAAALTPARSPSSRAPCRGRRRRVCNPSGSMRRRPRAASPDSGRR